MVESSGMKLLPLHAYGSTTCFISILKNVFLLYHIDMFISVYKIDQTSFWWGELIFLIWNSFNDLLYGWMSDAGLLVAGSSESRVSQKTLRKRIRALWVGGCGLAISFLLFWFPFPFLIPGLHFALALCAYDGFLTWIDLNHAALLADLATLDSDRSGYSLVGSLSVFFSFIIWDKDNLNSFRIFCVILACISIVGFFTAAKIIARSTISDKKWDSMSSVNILSSLSIQAEKSTSQHRTSLNEASTLTFIKQMFSNPNFVWFSVLNVIQVFHCHFNSNFFPLFLEVLLFGTISPFWQSMLLGISFAIPHINNIYFSKLVQTHGVYIVVRGLIALKVLLAGTMLLVGRSSPTLLLLFIASNRIFTEGTCKLLNLVISDLVDEDYVRNHRSQTISALIFGTCNFLAKPGQTFAPLVGTWIISQYASGFIFNSDVIFGDFKNISSMHRTKEDPAVQNILFQLLISVPLICGSVQLFSWQNFSLHGEKLNQVKRKMRFHQTSSGDISL